MSTLPRVAEWVPPALLDAPAVDGSPRLLEALLAGVDRQRLLLEADIDQVWDDLFIESCADWAVPYIGALVGLPPDADRLEVAYAVALRRRKGTPLALEDFARVLTGWTALAIEGWQVTIWAQRLGHPGPPRPAAADLRAVARRHGDSPFAPLLRSVTPSRRWSPRAATALVWPWRVRTYTSSRAKPFSNRRYALHPLGLEAPLYVRPRLRRIAGDVAPAALARRTADERDAPVRATYRVLESLAQPGQITYGPAWQVARAHPLASAPGDTAPPLLTLFAGGRPVPWESIRFTTVTSASPAPPPDQVYVDLMRGHVQLGTDFARGLRAVWHRPVSGEIGALAAEPRRDVSAQVIVSVDPSRPPGPRRAKSLQDAFALARTILANSTLEPSRPDRPDVEIRLETPETLASPSPQHFAPALPRWRIVAPTLMTPTIRGGLTLDLPGAEISLEGFALGGDLTLGKRLAAVRLDGITMNPAAGRTLIVEDGAWELTLEARRSLLAPVRSDLTATPIRLVDCIVDGAGRALTACGPPTPPPAPRAAVQRKTRFAPALSTSGTTFVGTVEVEAVDGVDCLFVDGVDASDQSDGCLRHCYLGPQQLSHPATYRCLTHPPPSFVSEAFEAGGYYALELEPDHPLLSAASDGGEVGAYHHARRAASLHRLQRRIHEFTPLGLRGEVALAPWEER